MVAATDLIAPGCYDVLRDRGLTCPGDFSIAGFNDMPFMNRIAPPLTSVAIPQYDIGREGAKLLLDSVADPGRSTPGGAAPGLPERAGLDRGARSLIRPIMRHPLLRL